MENQNSLDKPKAPTGVRSMRWLYGVESWLLEKLQARCPHDSRWVSADILEGGMHNGYTQLQLCRRCGAVRFVFGDHCAGEKLRYDCWRTPHPSWCKPYNIRS